MNHKMSNEELRAQMNAEAALAEAAADVIDTGAPLPPHVKVSRPNRARGKVLQIRLTDEEFDALEAIARRQDLQVSAFARDELLGVVQRFSTEPSEVEALVGSLAALADRLKVMVGGSGGSGLVDIALPSIEAHSGHH